jgi:hypothetical protein
MGRLGRAKGQQEGIAVPDDQPRLKRRRRAFAYTPSPTERPCHGSPARCGHRDRDSDRHHTFPATGITTFLKNGGTLEGAAAMANHASTATTQLYDWRKDEFTLDDVERIVL